MWIRAAASAAVISLALHPCAAQDFESIQPSTIAVTDGIYMVSGGGGNIGVSVGPDGILLVDTQFAQLEDKIRAAITAVGQGPVRYVLDTHWHFDHTGCNACFAEDGAVIIAPAGARDLMASEQQFPLLGSASPASSEEALPAISVTDEITLHFNGDDVRAVFLGSAHSGADMAVLFRRANVLHTGDLYWSQGYPYLGTPHGGSVDGLIAAVDRMLSMIDRDTRVIPGHGALSDRAGLESYRDMLVELRRRIAEQIAQGRTVDEIVASKPTADFDAERKLGMPPEIFVRLLHRDLS